MVARARKYYTHVYRELFGERRADELKIDVVYTRSRYFPAQTYGPAESCYPAEGGEIEILAAVDQFGVDHELTDAEHAEVDANFRDVEGDEYDD